METPTDSQASAENPVPKVDGAPPPTPAPAVSTNPTPVTNHDAEPQTLEEIKALMRQNDDALVRSKADRWTGLTAEEEQQASTPATETETPTTTDEAPPVVDPAGEEVPNPEPKPPTETPETAKPKKDLNRVRINRFAEQDRMIIQRMGEKDGLTIEAAKAELIAEGKIKPTTTAAPASTTTEKKDETTDAITTKTADIAALEKQIAEAAANFDAVKLAKLNIDHNRAMKDLGVLEQRAEIARSQAQAQEQSTLEVAVEGSKASAVQMFPDAGIEGSELFEAMEDLIDAAPASAFSDPDWPLTFAAKAARNIGYQPSAAKPAAPAPLKVVPKKPAVQVPVNPGSGSLAPGTTKTPTPEETTKAALDSNDPEKIRAELRARGTRSLDG